MKIKAFTRNGVQHVAFRDPTHSGCVCLPIGPGESPYASPGNKWSFDGNLEAPTLHPSVKSNLDHFWVKNGEIQFCPDARHPLAGQTVPMEDMGDMVDFFKDT